MPQHFCPVCLEDITCKRCKGTGKYYPPYSTHKIVHDECHGTGKIPHGNYAGFLFYLARIQVNPEFFTFPFRSKYLLWNQPPIVFKR